MCQVDAEVGVATRGHDVEVVEGGPRGGDVEVAAVCPWRVVGQRRQGGVRRASGVGPGADSERMSRSGAAALVHQRRVGQRSCLGQVASDRQRCSRTACPLQQISRSEVQPPALAALRCVVENLADLRVRKAVVIAVLLEQLGR